MAHIGMKYPVAAPWTEGETYTKGFVVGKAIKFTGTPNKNDVDLYADDGIAETDKSVKDIGVSLNVDDLDLKVQADLLGHDHTEASAGGSGGTATPESVEVGSDDVAPYFGTGFYKRRRKNNETSFTAIWSRFHFGDLRYWESLFMCLESYRFIIRIRYTFFCADGSFRMRNYRMKEEL